MYPTSYCSEEVLEGKKGPFENDLRSALENIKGNDFVEDVTLQIITSGKN